MKPLLRHYFSLEMKSLEHSAEVHTCAFNEKIPTLWVYLTCVKCLLSSQHEGQERSATSWILPQIIAHYGTLIDVSVSINLKWKEYPNLRVK
jgi:hypothetical protein